MKKVAREVVAVAKELVAGDVGYSLFVKYPHDGRHMTLYNYSSMKKYESLAKKMGGKIGDSGFVLDSDRDELDFTTIAFRNKEDAQDFHKAMDDRNYWKRLELHADDRRFFPKVRYVEWDRIDPSDEVAMRDLRTDRHKLTAKMGKDIASLLAPKGAWVFMNTMTKENFLQFTTKVNSDLVNFHLLITRKGTDADVKLQKIHRAVAQRPIVKKFSNIEDKGEARIAKWVNRVMKSKYNTDKIAKELVAMAKEMTARDISEDAAKKKFDAIKKKVDKVTKSSEKLYQVMRSIDGELSSLAGSVSDSGEIKRGSDLQKSVESAKKLVGEVVRGLSSAGYNSARVVKAADADLEAIAEVVKNNKFLKLKRPLKDLGLRNVDFNTYDPPMPGAMWKMKTKRGKTVAIVNKKHADPSSGDVVVGEFIVGYM